MESKLLIGGLKFHTETEVSVSPCFTPHSADWRKVTVVAEAGGCEKMAGDLMER